MAFNPDIYLVEAAKPLPLILLLDVSGSMQGDKINTLNSAVREMLTSLSNLDGGEREIQVAVISFGNQVKLHMSYTKASDAARTWSDLRADGMTPMGAALRMAKAMIDDKDTTPTRIYRPVVVLVSDGQPNDEWEKPLNDFISGGRSAKCTRMAMAIGADADADVLNRFIGNSTGPDGKPLPLFRAENASEIPQFFKFVTATVTQQVSQNIPTPKRGTTEPHTPTSTTRVVQAPAVDSNDADDWM